MALSPKQILAALDKWKVNYRLYPGWATRGRPGTWNGNKGFMWHHTGGTSQSDAYLKFLFIDGRGSEGIPGPLCQFAIRSDGVVFVGAAGRANHAGRGSSTTLDRVRREAYDGYSSELNPGPDSVDGNAEYLGVEIMYPGTTKMTAKQYASAIRLAAAITTALGGTALSALGHREHSRRKWDPGQANLATMRRDTRAVIRGGTPTTPKPPPPPKEEDEVSPKDWTAADKAAARVALFGEDKYLQNVIVKGSESLPGADGSPKNLAWVLRVLFHKVDRVQGALSKDLGVTPEQVATLVEALKAAIVESIVEVNVNVAGGSTSADSEWRE